MTSESILAPIAALALPNSGDLTGRAQRALAFVQEYQIASAEDYSLAADELRAIKKRQQGLEEQRTGITGPINQALRAINALFKGPGDLLDQAEQILKGKMLAYEQEQRRIAAETEAQRRQALALASGALSRRVEHWRSRLVRRSSIRCINWRASRCSVSRAAPGRSFSPTRRATGGPPATPR